jgi:hypothetical protein
MIFLAASPTIATNFAAAEIGFKSSSPLKCKKPDLTTGLLAPLRRRGLEPPYLSAPAPHAAKLI